MGAQLPGVPRTPTPLEAPLTRATPESAPPNRGSSPNTSQSPHASQLANAAASTASAVPEPNLVSTERRRALERTVQVAAAPKTEVEKEYDYVFIGAGATGSAAASDLVHLLDQVEALKKKGFSVLVLEGGKDKEVEVAKVPLEHGLASEHPDLLADPNNTGRGTGYWVKHYSDPADGKKDHKANEQGEIWKPRGAGFGGSTRMNANVFVRVDDVDWNAIALSTGDPAFRAENMKKHFRALEKASYRPLLQMLHTIGQTVGWESLQNMGGHGFDGKLEITRASPKLLFEDKQAARIALQGMWWAMTRLGSPMEKLQRMMSLFDPNDDRAQGTEGAVLMPMSINSQGRRNGARDLLLGAKDAHPDRLELRDGARVKNLVLDDENRCTGVTYVGADGKEQTVRVKREAIVAAGSLETPALLMRSGIGPADELKKLEGAGVKPKVILDGVGKKQGDRYEVGVVVRMKEPFELVQKLKLPAKPGDPAYDQWAAGQGGPLAINGAILSFQARSRPDLKDPDLFVFAVPGDFRGYKPGYSVEAAADPHLLTFLVLDENKGEGRGTLQVNAENPLGAPIINHHFHKERAEGDSLPVVAGVKMVRDLVASQFANLVDGEVWPGPGAKTDADLKAAVEAESWGHHPRGGAQMGHANDSSTVVDSNFQVLGTRGLRVIDASMLPDNIGSFIVSGLYQIGKLAAEKIARDAESGPKPAAKYNPLSIRTAELPKNMKEAREVTERAADAAKAEAIITPAQHKRLTDGTVSKVDMDVAWAAIEDVLGKGETIASDRHTVAHNLLLAVSHQLDLQSPSETRMETFADRARRMLSGS